jgi:hypothetical protein
VPVVRPPSCSGSVREGSSCGDTPVWNKGFLATEAYDALEKLCEKVRKVALAWI